MEEMTLGSGFELFLICLEFVANVKKCKRFQIKLRFLQAMPEKMRRSGNARPI